MIRTQLLYKTYSNDESYGGSPPLSSAVRWDTSLRLGELDREKIFRRLPEVTSLGLPADVLEILRTHPVQGKLQRAGDSAVCKLDYYSESGDLTGFNLGESIQSAFVTKTLRYLAPKLKIEKRSTDKQSLGDRLRMMGKKVIELQILDQGEHGRQHECVLDMPILKAANPTLGSIDKSTLRSLLQVAPDSTIASIYQVRGKAYNRAKDYGVPTIDELVSQIDEACDPDILFVSVGGSAILPSQLELRAAFRERYLIHALSSFSPVDLKEGRRHIILNDWSGRLPYLHAAADVSVVIGPVNIFEPLAVGTPLVVIDNVATVCGYDPQVYKKMVATANSTGGLYVARNTSDLSSVVDEALHHDTPITPPYAANNYAAFRNYLNMLEHAVDSSLSR